MIQGEVWIINLNPTKGAEIKKTRPAIIVNDDSLGKLPLRVIVPITEWKDKFEQAPWMIKITPDKINNLDKESSADCFQIRSLSNSRFKKKLGEIDADTFYKIKSGIAKVISLE